MVTVTVLCLYEVNVNKWRGHLATSSWKVGGMATPAPTYSYPHVINKTLTCHITLSALRTHCCVVLSLLRPRASTLYCKP